MDLILICLIMLIMFIQIFNTISNVYLTKLVIQLSKENIQIKHQLKITQSKIRLQEWTQLKLLQERYLQSLDS